MISIIQKGNIHIKPKIKIYNALDVGAYVNISNFICAFIDGKSIISVYPPTMEKEILRRMKEQNLSSWTYNDFIFIIYENDKILVKKNIS